MGLLFILFVVTPVVELWLLIQVGAQIGAGWTIVLVITTGTAGAAMARREGFKALRTYQESVARGELPTRIVLDGFAIFAGGALLMTPGIVTDLLGFALLFEPTRRLLGAYLIRRFQARMVVQQQAPFGSSPFGGRASGFGPRAETSGQDQERVYDATLDEQSDDEQGDLGSKD